MKNKSVTAILAAVLVCAAACSRAPQTPTAANPTPTPTPAPTPIPEPRVVYVGNSTDHKVYAFDVAGTPAAGFTPIADIRDPMGLAVDPATHTLYVSDMYANQVRAFDAATGAEKTPGFAKAAAGLSLPHGLALAGGNLLVANRGGDNVLAFNAATGGPATGFTSPKGLQRPSCMAVRGGTLYVDSTLSDGSVIGAYNLTTGAPVAGFTPVKLSNLLAIALTGNALFTYNPTDGKMSEYDATTGAVLVEDFNTEFSNGWGLAALGPKLFASNKNDNALGMWVLPDAPSAGNKPVSINSRLIRDVRDGVSALAVSP